LVLLEDDVHGLGTLGDHRLELVPVYLLATAVLAVTDEKRAWGERRLSQTECLGTSSLRQGPAGATAT
jgi:hypothetical protein